MKAALKATAFSFVAKFMAAILQSRFRDIECKRAGAAGKVKSLLRRNSKA